MYTSKEKARAATAFYIFSAVWFVLFVSAGYVMAHMNDRGSGIGDGYTVQSCFTPGGPYYVKRLPRAEQACPNPTTSQLKYPGQSRVGRPHAEHG